MSKNYMDVSDIRVIQEQIKNFAVNFQEFKAEDKTWKSETTITLKELNRYYVTKEEHQDIIRRIDALETIWKKLMWGIIGFVMFQTGLLLINLLKSGKF